jgi:hypothetical protein
MIKIAILRHLPDIPLSEASYRVVRLSVTVIAALSLRWRTARPKWASEALEEMMVKAAKHPLARKAGQMAEKVADMVRLAVDWSTGRPDPTSVRAPVRAGV